MLREAEIKAKVLSRLRRDRRIDSASIIATEYPIYRQTLRADIAVLAKNFIGIEIKSDGDSLRRLHGQLRVYQSTFDEVVVVLAEKHLQNFAKLCLHIEGLEIWIVDRRGEIISQQEARATYPLARSDYSRLLTNSESKRFAYELSVNGSYAAFRSAFGKRYRETTDRFWRQVKGRQITQIDISTLSRFEEKRLHHRQVQSERSARWANWAQELVSQWRSENDQSFHSSSVS